MGQSIYLEHLEKAGLIYERVVRLSEKMFQGDNIGDTDDFVREAQVLLQSVKGTDVVIGIFDHRTYTPLAGVGADEFWGPLPGNSPTERMRSILELLEKEYHAFPVDSVKWFAAMLNEIPPEMRVNMKIHHCGICYRRRDGKRLRLFSQGVPFHYDAGRNFSFTFNYVQNIAHLFKKDFTYYWIRLSCGPNREYVRTLHSENMEYSQRDLLSAREKEILALIAEDLDTKEIAQRLFISPNTVGNHRSNMIERLGARDTTALVQLAKMAGMI